MPQRKEPIKQRPKVEDENTGNPSQQRGKHKQQDEALPGKKSTKGGLNKATYNAEVETKGDWNP